MRTSLVALALAAALAGGLPLDTIWSFFTSAWSASADEGCILDPNGRCRPAPQADSGLDFDPSSSTAPHLDAGCGLDPDGRCNPASQTDAGCGLDPNG